MTKHHTTLEYIEEDKELVIRHLQCPKNTRKMTFQVPSMSLVGVNLVALLSQKGIPLVAKKTHVGKNTFGDSSGLKGS
jgi:hypothetical protein